MSKAWFEVDKESLKDMGRTCTRPFALVRLPQRTPDTTRPRNGERR